ncbi:MAG TPA: SIS domain-containing protein [Armatimonadota bacterium]|jgi:D-sedoheptulose 7-phosphate isomerase
MEEIIRQGLRDSAALLERVAEEMTPQIATAAAEAIACLQRGGKIALCGNGGSASQAQHLAGELIGRFRRERPAYAGIAFNADTTILTAIGNDYGYDEVFRRQVEGLLVPGDMLVCLSTSGNSENLIRAAEQARANGIFTLGMTGASGGRLGEVVDLCLRVPYPVTSVVQEAHLAMGHLICELIEVTMVEAGERP